MTTPNIEELIAKLSYYSGDGVQIDMARQAQRQAADALQSQAERIAELERESETHAKAYGLAIVERDNLHHELKVAQEGWRCECSTDDACRFARERDALRAELEKQQVERLLRIEAGVDALIAERDALRAQLAEIAATDPVLVVEKEPDYWSGGHFHEGSKPYIKSTKVWRLPIGTKLFTRPMPVQSAEHCLWARNGHEPCQHVKPAQAVTELVEALEKLARLGNGEHYGNSDGNMIARSALTKHKGAK